MSLKYDLSEALDDLASSRSSMTRRTRALDTIERLLAQTCAFSARTGQTDLEMFLTLQSGFECNVACRLMHSVSTWIPMLQQSVNSPGTQQSIDMDIHSMSRIIIQSLSVLQGIALLHAPSKDFLGKKWCIQVFVDLLAVSRHLFPTPLSSTTNTISSAASVPGALSLASNSIDTLLCVLVDSPAAIRAFEDEDGVEVVVKTLKRTGVARDIRIKCLEFLYFYLLDETGEMLLGAKHNTVPSHPVSRNAAPFPAPENLHNSAPPSPEASPDASPRKIPRNLRMLRKDVDFVPVTPKKVQISRLGVGTPRAGHPRTPQCAPSPTKKGHTSLVDLSTTPTSPTKGRVGPEHSVGGESRMEKSQEVRRKTTQEKKELLGSLLGNVESLVESVAKSGIWGLG